MQFCFIIRCKQQSLSWEANRFWTSQEIHHILWNLKVHYRIHKSPTLSQLNPVHAPTPSWRSTLILSSHLHSGLPNGLFFSTLPTTILHAPLLPPIHATCSAHLLFHPNNIWWAVQIIKLHARLDYYAASSGNFSPTFRDHYTLRNNPDERSSHLFSGGSLKSHINLPFM